MKRHFRELSVALALGVLLLFLAVAAPGFFQPQPLLSLLTREAPTLVVACGMALVIICRQIDISVGSQFAVCSVCAGLLAAMKWPLALVLPASVGIGALMGAFVNLPDGVQWFGVGQTAGQWTLIVTAVMLLVLLALAMKKLSAGRFVYA